MAGRGDMLQGGSQLQRPTLLTAEQAAAQLLWV